MKSGKMVRGAGEGESWLMSGLSIAAAGSFQESNWSRERKMWNAEKTSDSFTTRRASSSNNQDLLTSEGNGRLYENQVECEGHQMRPLRP